MAEKVRDQYVAILVPDHRVTTAAIDATDSSYTQAGPIPGVPDPQQDTAAVLVASGSQSAAGTLDVMAQPGGYPARTGGAGVLWRPSSATGWRGWDEPTIITGWEAVSYTTTSTTHFTPDIATLADERVIVAYGERSGGTTEEIHVRIRSTAGVWGAEIDVYSEEASGSQRLQPCILILPSPSGTGQRIVIYHWVYVGDDVGVGAEYSDDDGATWQRYSSSCVPDTGLSATSDTPRRLAAAERDGQVLLVGHVVDASLTADDILIQWASDSAGVRFVEVERDTGAAAATSGGWPGLVATDAGFCLLLVRQDTNRPRVILLASAYDAMSLGTAVAVAGANGSASTAAGAFTDGDQCIVRDDDGTLYVYTRDPSDFSQCASWRSVDNGATWTERTNQVTSPDTYWHYSGDASTYPYDFRATVQRGRVVMAHNWAANPGNEDQSLGMIFLGGYSTVTHPLIGIDATGRIAQWQTNWLPFDLPGDVTGWTAAGTAATESLDSPGELHVVTTAGNTRTYSAAPVSTIERGLLVEIVMRRAAGTPLLRLRTADGVDDYDVSVYLDATSIRIFDNNGTALLASAAVDTTAHQRILVAIAGGVASVWYREDDTDEDRVWTRLLDASAVTDDAATPEAGNLIQWGTDVAGVHDVYWAGVAYTYSVSAGNAGRDGLAAYFATPADLRPRAASTLPVYLDDGVRVSMRGGPAAESDEWAIDADYQYPIRNVCPLDVRSPSRTWRSTSTADQDLVYQLDTIGACDWPSDLLGVWIQGTNASQVLIQTESVPGAGYVTRATVKLWDEVGFTRAGKSVELTSCDGDTPTWSIVDDELVGADWIDGEAPGSIARQITRHTGGHLPAASGATNRRPRLYCAAIDGSESAANVGKICFRRALIVVQLAGVQPSSVRVRLEVEANTPAPSKGYIEAAKVVLGPVYVLGWSPSADRSRRQTPTVDVSESPGGQRRVIVRGPVRRSVDVTWSGGVNEAPYYAGTDDYVLASDVASAEPVGMVADAYALVSGLVEHLDGPAIPCVLIPALPHLLVSPTSLIHWRAGGCIYGSIVGDIVATTLLGDEQSDEVTRFGFRFEEEL